MKNKKHRVFLGIPVSHSIHAYLNKLIAPYQHQLPEGHWIPPENTHITICFFGDIKEEELRILWNNLKNTIEKNTSPFSINITKIATFPEKNNELIVAYLEDHPLLQRLFTEVNEISIHPPLKKEMKFIPHITLFRGKKAISMPSISLSNCMIRVEKITLFESKLIEQHRIYETLHSINFLHNSD